MDGRLTKTKLKKELKRRIEFIDNMYSFNTRESSEIMHSGESMMFGRYVAMKDIYYQIDKGLFIDGYVF